MKNYDITVIGGGPSGMMAAISAASAGASVRLIDKNAETGKKLLITGNGRCNLANSRDNLKDLVSAYGDGGSFLYSAFSSFGVKKTLDFFKSAGVETVIRDGGRVFPASGRASDVRKALLDKLEAHNVKLLTGCSVNFPVMVDGAVDSLDTSAGSIKSSKYILCTGGKSYPHTGSSGDGYSFAKTAGHRIVKPMPALAPVFVRETCVGKLAGIALENAEVSVYQGDKKLKSVCGEVLFTHKGLSGPAILNLSGWLGEIRNGGQIEISINATSFDNEETARKALISLIQSNPDKALKRLDSFIRPQRLWEYVIEKSGVDPSASACNLNRESRGKIIRNAVDLRFTLDRVASFDLAMVTKGGVELSEVEPSTMRSRIAPDLYFAGEILNIDGPTGGFNLQMCWSTGFAAGKAAAEAS